MVRIFGWVLTGPTANLFPNRLLLFEIWTYIYAWDLGLALPCMLLVFRVHSYIPLTSSRLFASRGHPRGPQLYKRVDSQMERDSGVELYILEGVDSDDVVSKKYLSRPCDVATEFLCQPKRRNHNSQSREQYLLFIYKVMPKEELPRNAVQRGQRVVVEVLYDRAGAAQFTNNRQPVKTEVYSR